MNSSYNVHMGSIFFLCFHLHKKKHGMISFCNLAPLPIKLLSIEKTVRPSFLERKKIRTMMDEVAQWMKKFHLISFFFHHLSLSFHQKLSFKVHTVECKVIHPIVCTQNSTKISCMDLIFT